MTIYEPKDFNKIWDSKWMAFNRSVDKLKKMRLKIARDKELETLDGTPTAIDLEQQFTESNPNENSNP